MKFWELKGMHTNLLNSTNPIPSSPDDERGILGCMLLAPAHALESVAKFQLRPTFFYEQRNRLIFDIITEMLQAGEDLTVLTLYGAVRERGFEEQAPVSYLATLEDCTPTAVNFGYHAKVIRKLGLQRIQLGISSALGNVADDPQAIVTDLEVALAMVRTNWGLDCLPPIVSAPQLVDDPAPLPNELIYGILHRGSKLALGGGSKSFKTWCLLDLAVSVAAGEPWWSRKTAKGRVLFINFEIQAEFFRDRIRTICAAKRIDPPAGLELWNLRGQAASADVILPKIAERIRDSEYSLIVLDPIYKLYGNADENSAKDIAALMNSLERLARTANAAVAFGSHFSKGNQSGKESLDRMSGSGVFARDPDCIITMTPHEAEDAFTIEPVLRNFKPVEPFVLRWLYPLMRRDEELDPSKLKPIKGRRNEQLISQILSLLPESGADSRDWLGESRKETGVSPATFFRVQGLLRNNRKIVQEGTIWKRCELRRFS